MFASFGCQSKKQKIGKILKREGKKGSENVSQCATKVFGLLGRNQGLAGIIFGADFICRFTRGKQGINFFFRKKGTLVFL
jgi:hypothetical protein